MAEYKKQYNPHRSAAWNYGGANWKLSRSKIELFVECPRCFYIDNKFGTARPRGPSFTINVAVDELFKREFDTYRDNAEPHPLMEKYEIDAVPFKHDKLEDWRENFTGIQVKEPQTGLTISGAVDDIWVTPTGALIVVDYKATSKEGTITTLADSSWADSYARQMGVYQWLLKMNGFTVEPTGYFVYANALKAADGFYDTLEFETTVVPCTGETDWIDKTIINIKTCLDTNALPPSGSSCEYCPYREACGKQLQALYYAEKKSKA